MPYMKKNKLVPGPWMKRFGMPLGADETKAGDGVLLSWAKDVGQSIVGAAATSAQSVANIVSPPTAQTTATTPPAAATMPTTTKLAIAGGAVVLAALIFKKRG